MLPAKDYISFFPLRCGIYFMTSILILWLGSLVIALTQKHSFTWFLWLSGLVNLLYMAADTFYYSDNGRILINKIAEDLFY